MCGSRRVCANLCGSRRVCSGLCRDSRLCSKLLCSGFELLQHGLLPEEVLHDAQAVPAKDLAAQARLLQGPQDPLLQEPLWQRLRNGLRPDLRCSRRLRSSLCCSGCLCSDLRRPGCLCSDLCRSGCLLPVV